MGSDWDKYTDYELAANREEAYRIGLADAMRAMTAPDGSCYTEALHLLVRLFPAAVRYLPTGSRPGEAKPQQRAQIEYREGEVYYHRPGNYGHADSYWRVPRDHLR